MGRVRCKEKEALRRGKEMRGNEVIGEEMEEEMGEREEERERERM